MSALQFRGIVKRFGGVAAVDGVSLSLEPGEVLALVGENGAGKSTLVGVASGLYRQDAGTVCASGQELPPGDPRAAVDAGIGVVFQQSMLVPRLRVWENVVLGREPRRYGFIDARRARQEVAAAARQAQLEVDPDAPVEALGVAAQQRIEIVKQLWRGARVLILDEPTTLLAPAEVDALLRTVRGLAAGGRAVLFISHKLREVFTVADRIAVLRRGKLVQLTNSRDTSASQLAEAVMGSSPTALPTSTQPAPSPPSLPPEMGPEAARAPLSLPPEMGPEAAPRPVPPVATLAGGPDTAGSSCQTDPLACESVEKIRRRPPGRQQRPGLEEALVVAADLRCEDDRGREALKGLSFRLWPGEILGVAGVDGNGQKELAEVIAGLRRARGSLVLGGDERLRKGGWARGSLVLGGDEGLRKGGWARSARAARRRGIVHLPDDRARRALCLPLTVEENFALGWHAQAPYARGALIDVNGRRQKARDLIASFDVRPPDPLARAAALSGGNQQKLVAARELVGGSPPRLVVAVQPTRGLDFAATRRVHTALRNVRDGGAAVLLISFDLDELRDLSDRILVIHDGGAAGEVPPDASVELLERLMLGEAA
ncbi:MAG TPA: ATP-binding cassette domain-containing protein [Myxococcales bacterium]|nr:ATP-binding cassette domain-containing protein [Myxococcales bacterium]